MIYEFLNHSPQFDESNFIAPSADLIGNVTLGKQASVWFNTTIRGDVNKIIVGARSNVQDNTCIHVMHDTGPTIIGDDVTIGHSVTIHGCTVHDRVLIGIQSVILDKAIIEPDCIIAAGSLVAPGKVMPSGYLCMGTPAKPVRKLTDEELKTILEHSQNYVRYSRAYQMKDTYETNPFYKAD